MTDGTIYVYGLMSDADAGAVCAADPSGRLLRVSGGPVAAVGEAVSPASIASVTDDDERLAALARRHDSVVHLQAAYGATLPVRLGTLCEARQLSDVLHAAEAELLEQLHLLAGCGEWRLRVRPATAPARDRGAERARRSALTGTEYLMQRRTRRTAVAEPPTFADLDAVLAEFSVSSTAPGEAASGRSRSYLIETRRVDALLQHVTPLIEQAVARGEQVELTGPLPAYSFAAVQLGGSR